MPQQIGIELNEDVEAKLMALPSATTISERQLALHYLAALWDGKGDVFENGPLLGGVTRGLAMGMSFNEKREESSALYTYDWFSLNQPLDLPDDVWEHLVKMGLLTREAVADANAAGSFLPLFEALHRDEDYWPLVHPHVAYLPGHRGDESPFGEPTFSVPETDPRFTIAFVDGCKSWYGTKHWFREILPSLRPGADLFFQDFGHYTCFWIPMLVASFREHFELIAYVDHTYVWRLAETSLDVEKDFPDEPTDVDRATYDEAFDWLGEQAAFRGDRYALMIHQAHRAAAYACLGLKDEARDILDRLLMVAEWLPLREYLKSARVSPTYTPEGRVEL